MPQQAALESLMPSTNHLALKRDHRQDLGTSTAPLSVQVPRLTVLTKGRQTFQHQNTPSSPPVTKPHSSRTLLVNIGFVFALNSGFLNGLGLSGVLGKAAAVSSVTGTYTNAAVAFTNDGGSLAMLKILATPFFYMLGSFVNGLCNPEGTLQTLNKISLVQSAPLLLAGIMVLVTSSLSSIFGKLACLTLAMGLQNSWTSTIMPGNMLRTTHFSGLTSDFGTIVGQTVRGNYANTHKLVILAKLATGFWLGGMMSVVGLRSVSWMSPTHCLQLSALLYFTVWSAVTAPF